MSDKYDDSEERVRKVLRDLPRVKAGPDFEQRLARRVAGADPKGRASTMFSGRIPVPAYSAAAILILAVVSYYAFFRSGALPTPPITPDEIGSEPAAPPAPVNKPAGPAGKDELSAALKEDDREGDKQSSAGVRKSKEEVGSAPTRAPRAAVEHGQNAKAPAQSQQSVELKQKMERTQQSAEGVSTSGLKKESQEDAAEESVGLQTAPAAAPSVSTAPGQKSFAPQMQRNSVQASPYSVTTEIFKSALDSVHIKDSLRADSLRRARLDSLKKK